MITNIIFKNAEKNPHKVALIVNQNRLTYLELQNLTIQYSKELSGLGISQGSHVALLLPNSVEFVVCMLAAAHLNAAIVPLNPTLQQESILTAIEKTDINFVIAQQSKLDTLQAAEVINNLNGIGMNRGHFEAFLKKNPALSKNKITMRNLKHNGQEDFIITMTSGSTGAPKPIIFSQQLKIERAYSARDCYGLDESIVSLAATPLYHSLAQRLVLLPLLLGGTAIVMKTFTPKLWLQTLIANKVTFAIPVSSQLASIYDEMQRNTYTIDSLQTLVSSSALISTELKTALTQSMDCEIHEIYGTSEVGVITNLAPQAGNEKMGTVGKALPNVHVHIHDSNNAPLPIRSVGEIVCTTTTAFSGYYKQPQETDKAMKGGYFHTGDLGFLDEDGFLSFVGRIKDIIITGGINVYPKDIEAVLLEHTSVRECAVVGINDNTLGEAILAVISTHENQQPNTRELQRLCYKKLADYQQPLGYEYIKEIPKNNMGKIDKPMLRKMYAEKDLTATLRNILGR